MKIFLSLMLVMFASILPCRAEVYQIGPLPSSVPMADTMSAQKARDLRWQTEDWTGSDLPFIQTRDRIEISLKQGASLDALLSDAEAKAVQKPYEPTAQYAWCYLAYKAVNAVKYPSGWDTKFVRLRHRMHNSIQGMIFGTQPHSYEYSRLLFLTRAYDSGGTDYAVIGHRLMERNSEDDEVRQRLITIDENMTPPKTQEALDYFRYLYRKKKMDADFYRRIGDIYFFEFLTHKQSEIADEAIEDWHKSFQLSAPNDYDLKIMKGNIKWIHKVESEQAH